MKRLDDDVIAWFRQQVHLAGGGNYQTAINLGVTQLVRHLPPLIKQPLRVTPPAGGRTCQFPSQRDAERFLHQGLREGENFELRKSYNYALRAYINEQKEPLEEIVRRVVCEELEHAAELQLAA